MTTVLLFFNYSLPSTPDHHRKALNISKGLFLVFMLSLTPHIYALDTGEKISGYLYYTVDFNNLANFFVYLVVDEEFRGKLKAMCKRQSTYVYV